MPGSPTRVTYSDPRVFLPSATSRDPGTPASPASLARSLRPLITLQRAPAVPVPADAAAAAAGTSRPGARRTRPPPPPPPPRARPPRPSVRRRRGCREAGRREAAPRHPAGALQGPEEVCWPGTKHVASAGRTSSSRTGGRVSKTCPAQDAEGGREQASCGAGERVDRPGYGSLGETPIWERAERVWEHSASLMGQ